MQKTTFTQFVNLAPEQVWQFIFDKDTYQIWTSVYEATSSYQGDWIKGSEIKFINSDGSGMLSKVSDLKFPEFLFLTHLGEIDNGQKIYKDEYQGSFENYYLKPKNGGTEVTIETFFPEEVAEMMGDLTTVALTRVKLYCESQNFEVPKIQIEAEIRADIKTVWDCYTDEKHILNWNFADPSWHCPRATNNLEHGGKFSYRMEAKDGQDGFDLEGIYNKVKTHELISFTMLDGRSVQVLFEQKDDGVTKLRIVFEAESENNLELQKAGWQSILDNFRVYTEKLY